VAVVLRGGLGALRLLRGRSILVERVGGAMLLAVGVLLVTGLWDRFIVQLQPLIGGFRTPPWPGSGRGAHRAGRT
jgi:cytochrome c-type biogenesis protein